MNFIIIDTETTGLTKPSFVSHEEQPRIIDFAALLVNEFGVIIEEINEIIDPGIPIPEEIQKLTGITGGGKKFDLVIPVANEIFRRAKILAGHNIIFDKSLVQYELQRVNCDFFPWPDETICTVQEYKHLFGYRPNLKLLYEKIVGKELTWAHRAHADAMAVYEIMKAGGWFESS